MDYNKEPYEYDYDKWLDRLNKLSDSVNSSNFDEIINEYNLALSILPNNPYIWFNLSLIYEEIKEYEKQIDAIDKYLLSFVEPFALYKKSIALSKINNNEEAEKCYSLAKKIELFEGGNNTGLRSIREEAEKYLKI